MDVGVLINQYKIIEHIGRGGMADVWSARDQRLNRMVAIKTIAHGLSQEADPVGLFKQEAQTIAQMEHPHILPIYDFGEFESKLYIVMRYVAGGSLEDLLRRGPISLDDALRLGQAVAQALDYAHGNSVIHLDLKPANVLLDSHQSPYLADFGLATTLDPEGKAHNPGSGTLLYMAPEQLTSEIIDHRADIYSFCIVMFHMLTGQLPFEASAPLALKQMQYHEELPQMDMINSSVPTYFTDILRRGTSVDPLDRPPNLMELIEEMRDVLVSASNLEMMAFVEGSGDDYDPFAYGAGDADSGDAALLEAVDIYSRARHNWSGGNGRFLLGVTHFMLMNGYYMDAEQHGLELDREGKQMLLRGAIEYDHELAYWWEQLDPDDQRWVCLHALRSGNAPARVRALYRLETLPDSDTPQIPKLVAQALQIENNAEAQLAALQVLGTRAKLIKNRDQYDIKTEYRGLMLTSLTRLGIQVQTPAQWQEVVYSPEIDLLIASIALDSATPRVSEFAARIIGRIRSTTAVRYIVKQQQQGRRGALRALGLVRDEAPSLPDVVTTQGQLYAWSANTIRRLFNNPWGLFFRFMAGLTGGWIAMGSLIWATFRAQGFFNSQRWGNSLAVGLMFGVFTAILVVFSGEFSERLRGFWPNWARFLGSALLGVFLGTLLWTQFTWMYLQFRLDEMYMPALLVGGVGVMLGFVVTALFNLRSWIAIPLTVLTTYVPILLTWENYQNANDFDVIPLIYFLDVPSRVYSVAIPLAIVVAIGGHFPRLWRETRNLLSPYWMSWQASRRRQVQPIPIRATGTAPAVPANAAGQLDPAEVVTEIDHLHGRARQVPDAGATEIDRQQGAAKFESELDPYEDVQTDLKPRSHRVDIGSGIIVDREPPPTEPVKKDDIADE